MKDLEKVLEVAEKEVGTTEYPKNSNKVKYNSWYYGREVSGASYPWCAAFVSWVFSQVDSSLIKKSALCATIGNWFKSSNRFKKDNPKIGDVVFFKFSGGTSNWTNHVGIVVDVLENGNIVTIEGNTSLDDTGSQSNGGAVAKKTRNTKNVVGYGVPEYKTEDEAEVIVIGNIVHVVRSGETLSKIAERYGRNVDELASKNGIKNKNLIRVGQKITIY